MTITRIWLRLRRAPLDSALGVVAILCAIVAIAWPFAAARYPAMIDLPFHAAQTATFRHYFDPTFHFREQFELQPLAVPYLLMYGLGAALMLVLPMLTAVKVAAACMLALLPCGLAVLLRGMKKSPLLGVLGAGVAWLPLTHWGFLNFVGALGLFAMALGLTLIVLDRPTRLGQLALAVTLVALFFAHLFRFPLAIAAILFATLVMGKATRRIKSIALPLIPSLALFAIWLVKRPRSLRVEMDAFHVDFARIAEIPDWLTGAFSGTDDRDASLIAFSLVVVVALGSLLGRWGERGSRMPSRRSFRARAMFLVLASAAGSLVLFLALPMAIGDWWYVYPREATALFFLALAVLPELPRARTLRVGLFALAALAPLAMARMVAHNYAEFGDATEDFHAITRLLPQAPKLLYLVFDHTGSTRTNSPFVHLPAYVQAERGGWLSYHFTKYGASPLAYRDRAGRESIIPPPTPPLWEHTPERFEVLERGAFFDWFLIRSAASPSNVFAADPTIAEVAHVGKWWLYQRDPRRTPEVLAGR